MTKALTDLKGAAIKEEHRRKEADIRLVLELDAVVRLASIGGHHPDRWVIGSRNSAHDILLLGFQEMLLPLLALALACLNEHVHVHRDHVAQLVILRRPAEMVKEVRGRAQDVFELLLAGGDGERAATEAQATNLCIEDLERENVAGDDAELGRSVRGHGNAPALGARDVLHARSGVEHRTAVWGVIGDADAQVSKRLSSRHLHRNRAIIRERRDILELVAEDRDAGRIFDLVHYDVEERRVVGDVYVGPEHRELALERHVAPDVACAMDDVFATRCRAE
jgi:hypothetical protein